MQLKEFSDRYLSLTTDNLDEYAKFAFSIRRFMPNAIVYGFYSNGQLVFAAAKEGDYFIISNGIYRSDELVDFVEAQNGLEVDEIVTVTMEKAFGTSKLTTIKKGIKSLAIFMLEIGVFKRLKESLFGREYINYRLGATL